MTIAELEIQHHEFSWKNMQRMCGEVVSCCLFEGVLHRRLISIDAKEAMGAGLVALVASKLFLGIVAHRYSGENRANFDEKKADRVNIAQNMILHGTYAATLVALAVFSPAKGCAYVTAQATHIVFTQIGFWLGVKSGLLSEKNVEMLSSFIGTVAWGVSGVAMGVFALHIAFIAGAVGVSFIAYTIYAPENLQLNYQLNMLVSE